MATETSAPAPAPAPAPVSQLTKDATEVTIFWSKYDAYVKYGLVALAGAVLGHVL